MSRETSYLKLHLPDENEFYDVEKDQNKNFEKLDKKIEELDTFEKNSGYNLNKTDSYSDNDTNKLATAKALYEAYKNSAHVFQSLDFKGFHYNSEGDLYYFINNNTHRRLIDNRGGDVEKLSVGGSNVWHTGNFDPNTKIDMFGGYKFKGLHFNEQKDLYYFIDDKISRRLIDNRGGDVERLTINGAKVYHTENFVRHIWNGAYLANLNETSPFCILPNDWKVCIIGYQWVSSNSLGNTYATAVILRNHVPLNRWFLAHSGNPNKESNLVWGEARFMITQANGLISQGRNTYGGDCYVLTVDVI